MTLHEGSDDRAMDLEPRGEELPGDEPWGDEEEFAQEVRELVADEAPRVFSRSRKIRRCRPTPPQPGDSSRSLRSRGEWLNITSLT